MRLNPASAALTATLVLLTNLCFAQNGPYARFASAGDDVLKMDATQNDWTPVQSSVPCKSGRAICCSSSGFTVGAEAAFLQPQLGALSVTLDVDPDVTPTFDYLATPRVWLAYENCEGLGVRAAYWRFDSDASLEWPNDIQINTLFGTDIADVNVTDYAAYVGLEAQTIDLEMTQRGHFCGWQLLVAGGVRYGKMRTDTALDATFVSVANAGVSGFDWGGFVADSLMEFEGAGPTVALDVRRPLGSRGFGLVGGVRASWLFGNTDHSSRSLYELYEHPDVLVDSDGFELNAKANDHMMQIYSAQLGVEWCRRVMGGQLVARALWEAQAWELAPLANLLQQDVGFSGPTVSLAYVR